MPPSKLARQDHRAEFKRGFAKQLRAKLTDTERKLWALLRNKQVQGHRFRRQHPIGPYIVDFFCSAAKLIVELDGGQHGADAAIAYDAARTAWLEKRGYRVLRFDNVEFLKNPYGVLDGILVAAGAGTPPRFAEGRSDPPSGGGLK
jgi:very-short-patch-repair endonuclease